MKSTHIVAYASVRNRKNRYLYLSFFISILLAGCNSSKEDYDASGSFESTEIIVSAQASGELLSLNIEEGDTVDTEKILGVIDTTQLYLKKMQLHANERALNKRRPDTRTQIAILEQQLATATRERDRLVNLTKAEAASQKQLDDANAQRDAIKKQLTAQQTTLANTNQSIDEEKSALDYQLKQIEDQLRKSYIQSPIHGMVLVKYAEAGELAITGKPLFKVANMNEMILRAYVTGDQLSSIKTGKKVKIYIDQKENSRKEYEGTIQWISSKSEFTPKTIQTRNERANLVYAVKIKVKNDGLLKIGMYADVNF